RITMPRPIEALIHTDALAHNLARARRAAPDAKVWAVVKANAYGHGVERAYAGLQGADGFALLDIAEAERVRALGWRGPILLLERRGDAALRRRSRGARRLGAARHHGLRLVARFPGARPRALGPAADDDLACPADRHAGPFRRHECRLRQHLHCGPGDADRRGRLRLCRRLPAPRA